MMHNISSSISRAEATIPTPNVVYVKGEKQPKTPTRLTAVHHLGSIQASIRAREQLVRSFTDSISGENLPPKTVEHLSSDEAALHTIFDKFAQKLNAIEQERSTKIQEAKNRAAEAQAHGMRRGMGIAISSGVEENKKRAINDIETTAARQRNIFFLQAKQELLKHQQSYFTSLFEIYSKQAPSSSGAAPISERAQQCQAMMSQSFEAEKQIFTALRNLEQADERTIAAAIRTIALADTVRMRALHPFVEHSINTSLDQVEETSGLLLTLSQSKNKFLNTNALTAFHEELEQQHASYLLTEALFDGTAREVALSNASYLQNKIEDLKLELDRTSLEKTKATTGDQFLLDQKISLLTTLSTALEASQKAYERIADEASLKIKISAPLPSDSIQFPTTSDQESSSELEKALQSLSNLAVQTAAPFRTAGLDLLSKLSDFSETENNHAILGRRGEMELIDGRSTSFIPNAKLAQEGINLVRLAVFRDFGARGLQRFDAHFHDKITALESPEAQTFLTVGELKNFIETENQIDRSAFYLSSAHSITELFSAESDPVEDRKFIKSDGTSFNPFSKTAPSRAPLSGDYEKAEGLTATRAALKEFYKDLPPELRQSILNHFDEKFKTAKTPLTVGELRAFLKKEIETLQAFNLDVTGPFLYSLAWHLCTATLWATMMSAHPPAWIIMGISLGIGVGHDLTSYWRQLRPEDEK